MYVFSIDMSIFKYRFFLLHYWTYYFRDYHFVLCDGVTCMKDIFFRRLVLAKVTIISMVLEPIGNIFSLAHSWPSSLGRINFPWKLLCFSSYLICCSFSVCFTTLPQCSLLKLSLGTLSFACCTLPLDNLISNQALITVYIEIYSCIPCIPPYLYLHPWLSGSQNHVYCNMFITF